MEAKMLVLYAHWCPKCKMMMPIVDELEMHYVGKLQVTRIDVEKEPEQMEMYQAEIVPTFIVFRKDREVGRMSGMIGEKTLYRRIDAVLEGNTSLD